MFSYGKQIEKSIKQFALKDFPNESCGVITKKGKKLCAVRCTNTANDPENRFVISSEEYKSFIDTTGVYGIWHSHVNDARPMTPSKTDQAGCNATGVDWLIIDLKTNENGENVFGEFFHISPQTNIAQETSYIGRTYIFGVRDCFTLARDFYRKEFGIDVSFTPEGYPEFSDWQYRGLSLLSDNYEKAGFRKLINEEPVYGDIFLIQIGSANIPDHVAVYLGNDKILHHCSSRLSTVDIYGGSMWQKHTHDHLRWSDFK